MQDHSFCLPPQPQSPPCIHTHERIHSTDNLLITVMLYDSFGQIVEFRVSGVYERRWVYSGITGVTNELSFLLQQDMLPIDSLHKGPVIQVFHGFFVLSTIELSLIWDALVLMWSHCNVQIVREWSWGVYEYAITHWGRVMQICVSKLTIIGSDNGLVGANPSSEPMLEYC